MFIESGQLLEEYPDSKDRDVVIEIYCKYLPNEEGLKFIDCVKSVIEEAGFSLNFQVAKDK